MKIKNTFVQFIVLILLLECFDANCFLSRIFCKKITDIHHRRSELLFKIDASLNSIPEASEMTPVLRNWVYFLCGIEVKGFCRIFPSLETFRNANDEVLELTHDYIQLVFPNKNQSSAANENFYLNNPQLTTTKRKPSEIFSILLKNTIIGDEIKKNAVANTFRFLKFLGWSIEQGRLVSKNDSVVKRKLTPMGIENHNCLRVTRMINWLSLLNFDVQLILSQLKTIPGAEGIYSKFWHRASLIPKL